MKRDINNCNVQSLKILSVRKVQVRTYFAYVFNGKYYGIKKIVLKFIKKGKKLKPENTK